MIKPDWIYLIQVSLTLSVFHLIYWLLFSKNTNYQINRFILLSIVLLSAILPQLSFSSHYTSNKIPFVIGSLHEFDFEKLHAPIASNANTPESLSWLTILYWLGLLFTALRFAHQLLGIFHIKNNSVKKSVNNNLIYLTKNTYAPFSFFQWIFMTNNVLATENTAAIIQHEKIHVKQWHSIDILIIEIFRIIFWFLPSAYIFKKVIKQNHEFIVDHSMVKSNDQKISYLNLLAQQTELQLMNSLISNFNNKTLHQRINRLVKKPSSTYSKLLYLLFLPVVFIFLQAFSYNNQNIITHSNTVAATDSTTTLHFSKPIANHSIAITSHFGLRMHPIKKKEIMHNGVDYKAAKGTPVLASANGIVIRKEFSENGYGNVIAIKHSNGYFTLYAQLSEFNTDLKQEVKQGDVIGFVGSSGMSTGPHLHFEIRKDNTFLDPELLLK